MEFLSPIIGPVVESLFGPVKKHLGYLLSSTKHVRNMSTRLNHLIGTSIDVNRHMERNNIINLEVPTRVPEWLEAVKKIKEDAERISSNVNGRFNLKMRYRRGKKAFKTIQQIKVLINENKDITWSDAQEPLGKVSFKMASTSGPTEGDAQNCFKSREKTFKEALGLLQQDQEAQVIALCGMGGVGKTTMMEQLKKAVKDKQMFDWVVKEVIGEKTNTFSIQQTVAEYLQLRFTETSKTTRADRLRETFENISRSKKNKVLVVLDDVWEKVELKDIGLSPLPNGFKLLLTSRDETVCTQIAVEANSKLRVVRVNVMGELEANNFFCQISEVSNPELIHIGVKIVRKCGFLPLAIKLIATNLKTQENSAWRNTLHRLKNNELDKNVQRIIEISYNFIAEEDAKAVFLLCGLFPDDFNIPIEDLTRYSWGMKLLNGVPTLGDTRDRIKTCVLNLKKAYLLMDSDHSECVKLHDLVLSFVVAEVSKGDHPWIINHDGSSNWNRADMSESCRRISLTCMGMSEFPGDFNYPNVSLLRLMNGKGSLEFPGNFFEKMENLQVMAFEKLQIPMLPRSLQCLTQLTTLCLNQCSLLSDDFSRIGNHLLSLEVLSFAHSDIKNLPSAIGNLVKLKLLDLTGCNKLRIHEGVLQNLVNLEELYMAVVDGEKLYFESQDWSYKELGSIELPYSLPERKVRFTGMNYKELAERSKNLSALEVEFVEKNPQSKNMSYKKLQKFKISMGCYLDSNGPIRKDMYSHENTLKLVLNKDELLESGINELFPKTEVLDLINVEGMINNLEEVLPKSIPPHYLFYNLRVLRISGCADLRYLFTVPVARGLVKLEKLTVRDCPIMKALLYSENGEEASLPPHCLFYNLRDLGVCGCGDLRYIFTVPVARGLVKLEHLSVIECPVTESLLYSKNGQGVIRFQELKRVRLDYLPKLVGFSNTNDVIDLPQLATLELNYLPNLTSIYPECKSATSVLSGSNSAIKPFFNKQVMTPRLEKLSIYQMEALKKLWPLGSSDEVDACLLREIKVTCCANLVNMFPSNPMPLLHHLETIYVSTCGSIEALFDIDVGCLGEIKEGGSKLRSIEVKQLENFREVWRLKGVIDPALIIGGFQAVEKIEIDRCKRFINIVTPTTARFDLGALRDINIYDQENIGMKNFEEVLPTSVQQHNLFYILRVLSLDKCAHMRYLFTVPVARGFVKLEHLTISQFPVMESLLYNENGEEEGVIRFQELKRVCLNHLPKLVGFSNTNHVIDLPQLVELELHDLPNLTSIYPECKSATSIMSGCSYAIKPFLNKQVMTPRLEMLGIYQMDALKNLWPLGSSDEVNACLLREIKVTCCANLVNMFPSNPMPLLHHLETIYISACGSIEVLFDIDVGCLGEIKEGTSKLRSIEVHHSEKLGELWRLKDVIDPALIIGGFQAVELIRVTCCKTFRNIYTPTTARFDLGALRKFETYKTDYKKSDAESSEEENNGTDMRKVKEDNNCRSKAES